MNIPASKCQIVSRAFVAAMLATACLFAPSVHAQDSAQAVRLTLKQAVSRAVQNSSDVALARMRYQVSQREAGLARSKFLPNLYAGSGAAYTSGFPLLAGGGAPAAFTMSYHQALLDPVARADQHEAEQRSEQQRLEVDAVRDSVIVRVASSYLELAKTRRELELLKGERESAKKILDYTRQRMEAGYELPVEVTKAQLTSARVEQRIAQLEDQNDSLSDLLRTQLNLAPDQALDVAAEDIPAADQPTNDLVRAALENSVELKQEESKRAANLAELKGERGSFWPTISVIGQYNLLTKYNHYTDFFNKFQANNAIVGVEVRIPIFSARTSAALSFAQANVNAAELAVKNKRSQLSQDVRHQARVARERDTGREVARLEMDLSEQDLQVTQAQFREGRATLRDLEAAQLAQNDKWLAFLDADFARQQSQLDLLRSTGQVAMLFQ